MDIIKVLKRKDGASLVVGIVVAMVLVSLVGALAFEPARMLSGLEETQVFSTYSAISPEAGWQAQYLFPVILAALQLVALEILTRLYIAIHKAVSSK